MTANLVCEYYDLIIFVLFIYLFKIFEAGFFYITVLTILELTL